MKPSATNPHPSLPETTGDSPSKARPGPVLEAGLVRPGRTQRMHSEHSRTGMQHSLSLTTTQQRFSTHCRAIRGETSASIQRTTHRTTQGSRGKCRASGHCPPFSQALMAAHKLYCMESPKRWPQSRRLQSCHGPSPLPKLLNVDPQLDQLSLQLSLPSGCSNHLLQSLVRLCLRGALRPAMLQSLRCQLAIQSSQLRTRLANFSPSVISSQPAALQVWRFGLGCDYFWW